MRINVSFLSQVHFNSKLCVVLFKAKSAENPLPPIDKIIQSWYAPEIRFRFIV